MIDKLITLDVLKQQKASKPKKHRDYLVRCPIN